MTFKYATHPHHCLAGAAVATLALALAGAAPADEPPLAEARVYLQLNDTDGDLGLHLFADQDGWAALEVEGADGVDLLELEVSGALATQGLTELFIESSEPGFDELPPEVFFERFPEGTYEIEVETLDGDEFESELELTHVMPAPASNVRVSGQRAAADCDAKDLPRVFRSAFVRWDPVTTSHPEIGRTDPDIEIVAYQFVVEIDIEGERTRQFTVDLPPNRTRVRVPAFVLNSAGTDLFKYEILAREASGNETVVESCFRLLESA